MEKQIWWLSFASKQRGFLGVVLIRADSLASAVAKTHALRINPGGEVLGAPMPADQARKVHPSDTGRLLNKRETARYQGGKTIREREAEGQTLRDGALYQGLKRKQATERWPVRYRDVSTKYMSMSPKHTTYGFQWKRPIVADRSPPSRSRSFFRLYASSAGVHFPSAFRRLSSPS
jgi:hypothetical protein